MDTIAPIHSPLWPETTLPRTSIRALPPMGPPGRLAVSRPVGPQAGVCDGLESVLETARLYLAEDQKLYALRTLLAIPPALRRHAGVLARMDPALRRFHLRYAGLESALDL